MLLADLPSVEEIDYMGFDYCYKLKVVRGEELRIVQNLAFNDCFSLRRISLQKASFLGYSAFANCYQL